MGYTTELYGRFRFNKPLTAEDVRILNDFSEERHEDGDFPGIWCQWIPTSDGKFLEWAGQEKFYEYVEWLEYLIKNILSPKGYILNGSCEWVGEERGDLGLIEVKDNIVTTKEGTVTY